MDLLQNKNPRDIHGCTPLHAAAFNGHLEVCQAIMNESQDKNPSDNLGRTPLDAAAYNGNLGVCLDILHEIQDINPSDVGDHTPLYLAVHCGYIYYMLLCLFKAAQRSADLLGFFLLLSCFVVVLSIIFSKMQGK